MKTRIISAAVLALVLLLAIYFGGVPYLLASMLICGISAWEFGRIFDRDQEFRIPLIMLVVTVLILLLARYFFGVDASHRTLTFCIMATMTWGVVACEKKIPRYAISFTVLVTGMVYIGWLGGYMISLRKLDAGMVKVLIAFGFTWTTDIWAYFVGRAIGKHKMLPIVSPKKTWEGYFGGVIFSVITAVLAERFIPAVDAILNMRQIMILALMISGLSPVGDFGESMIKRGFGIKDSSNLIPGHGGFFDRFDSMFFSMPLAYYFFEAVAAGLF